MMPIASWSQGQLAAGNNTLYPAIYQNANEIVPATHPLAYQWRSQGGLSRPSIPVSGHHIGQPVIPQGLSHPFLAISDCGGREQKPSDKGKPDALELSKNGPSHASYHHQPAQDLTGPGRHLGGSPVVPGEAPDCRAQHPPAVQGKTRKHIK